MTTFDFAPLFRTAIGFDRLARLMDTAASAAEAPSYPPYNIEKTGEDTYRLTMAVAGFRPDELDMVVKDNTLVVSGKVANDGQKGEVLYRGIAGRAFERRFVLADHIVVDAQTCRTVCCMSASPNGTSMRSSVMPVRGVPVIVRSNLCNSHQRKPS